MSGRDIKPGQVDATLSRGYGTLAGLGIIGAAVIAVPSTLFLNPLPEAEAYLSTFAALAVGLICIALPWERMDARWLHLVGVIATTQAAIAVVLFGQVYVTFYFLIAVAAAYMSATWRELMAQLAVIAIALFGPVFWGPTEPADTLQLALLVCPLLFLTAGVFGYLRQRMVADQSSYRVFAEETLSLASRIAGHPLTTEPSYPVESDLPSWSQSQRISGRVAGAAAGVLAVPVLTAGLAVAGVKLPAFASTTLGELGIELPNQDLAQEEAAVATGSLHPLVADSVSSERSGGGASSKGDLAGGRSSNPEAGSGPSGESDETVGGSAESPSSSSLE